MPVVSQGTSRQETPPGAVATVRDLKGSLGMGIRITGVGAYVPETIVTNEELCRRVDTSNEWITQKTGIRQRRVSAPGESPSDMGVKAALRCLSHAGVAKSAVDLIVVACATPDQSQPAV